MNVPRHVSGMRPLMWHRFSPVAVEGMAALPEGTTKAFMLLSALGDSISREEPGRRLRPGKKGDVHYVMVRPLDRQRALSLLAKEGEPPRSERALRYMVVDWAAPEVRMAHRCPDLKRGGMFAAFIWPEDDCPRCGANLLAERELPQKRNVGFRSPESSVPPFPYDSQVVARDAEEVAVRQGVEETRGGSWPE